MTFKLKLEGLVEDSEVKGLGDGKRNLDRGKDMYKGRDAGQRWYFEITENRFMA